MRLDAPAGMVCGGGVELRVRVTVRACWGSVDVLLSSPVGLHEDAVDLFEVDGAGAVADGFQQGGDAEVACAPEDAL